ncbi:rod shape-determining protein MreC [candidate division WOR-3 bacterium]|nr:rod shape-determining protein MreC [candidate division WOR-3 bacterium]
MKRNLIFTYIILLLISLFLLIIDSKLKTPLNNRLYNLFSINIRTVVNRWVEYKNYKEKDRRLLEEIARLSYERQRYQALKKENEQLRKILEFETNFPKEIIPAEILNRVPEIVNISYMISKGHLKGIEVGDPVIGFYGVFGKVLKVESESAIVQTLMNYNVALSAMDQRSMVSGILKWDMKFYLEGIPLYADIEYGDTIVTSGRGSIFPEGLRIGKVVKISKDESAYSIIIEVEPFENFNNPDVVFLIKQ